MMTDTGTARTDALKKKVHKQGLLNRTPFFTIYVYDDNALQNVMTNCSWSLFSSSSSS